MPTSNIQVNSSSSSGRGSGLDSLFTLAHLAIILEEEQRSVAFSSPRLGRPATPTASVAVSAERSSPSASPASNPPRRPAKKRAVPADFDMMPFSPGYGTTANEATMVATPESPNSKSSVTSHSAKSRGRCKPTTKRSKQSKSRKQRGGSTTFNMKSSQPSFPLVLMGIMSAPQNKDFISFLSDGKSFIIIHPGVLTKNILPIHFEDDVPTFDQLLHLLAIWGFEVIKDPQYPRVNVYKHPMFRKGDWEACLKIKLPDPSDQQANKVVKATAKSEGGDNNDRHLNQPVALPHRNDVSVANKSRSPPRMAKARTVIPPDGSMFDVALLKQLGSTQKVATQTAQQPQIQQYSNLGPKLSSAKENLMYSRLLQGKGRGGCNLQPRLQQGISQGQMVGYSDSSVMEIKLRQDPRRASLCPLASVMHLSHSLTRNDSMPTMMGTAAMPFASGFHKWPTAAATAQPSQSQVVNNPAAPYSNDRVRSATEGIVSAAIDALCQNNDMVRQQQLQRNTRPPRSRRLAVDNMPSSTVCLDAMTDLFLERSRARLSYYPMGMMGSGNNAISPPLKSMQQQQFSCGGADSGTSMNGLMSRKSWVASMGAEVEAQTKAYLAPA